MRISLILPVGGNMPVGGVKIAYEYANRLVRRGHSVAVVHPAMLVKDLTAGEHPRLLLRYLRRLVDGSYQPRTWFTMDPRVRLLWVPSLRARHIPDADAVVATAWQTAEWVADYPATKGSKFYLIQGLETWAGPEARVMATWRLPMQKIVVARWLQKIAESLGEPAVYIPNGLDFEALGTDISPSERSCCRVAMLYHEAHWKGASEGLDALISAKQHVPELDVKLFGVPAAPRGLPPWAQYYRLPSQRTLRRLYNEAAVYVSASRTEGWGLTAAEALVCGCALAITDTGGHREFAMHDKTALLSPVRDPAALSANIVRLVRDSELRLRLACAGHELIQRFTWQRAVDALERALLHPVPPTIGASTTS